LVDTVSAVILLQSWMERLNRWFCLNRDYLN
jgi:hypothetical protein